MQPLTRQQARELDKESTSRFGIPSVVLMENAGRGVVDVLLASERALVGSVGCPRRALILCGKGNNGGDGFVIARHLAIRGIPARVALLAPPNELRGDALINYRILVQTRQSVVDLSAVDNLEHALDQERGDSDFLIDAILGTGALGEPREPCRTAIDWMNRQKAQRVAVDLPSGLDCDTGQPASITLRADLTCTFVAPKVGFASPAAREFLGEIQVVNIGIPPQGNGLL